MSAGGQKELIPMPSRIRYICGGTGPPRLLSYCIRCQHVAGNVLLGKCGACGRFGLHIILYIHVVAGTVCFSAVYGLDTCQVVNTFCRMVSLRLGLGCFYRSSSAPLIRPSQAFSVHAAGAVSLLSRYQSSACAWPFPVRLPRGLHARAATSTHECKVTLNLLNAQIIA